MSRTTRQGEESIDEAASSIRTLRLLHSGTSAVAVHPPQPLHAGETVIGRDGAGVALAHDERVSRRHAVIECRADGLRIVEAGSRNGTFVNGRRVESAPLANGDWLRIGDSFLIVRFELALPVDGPVPGLVGISPAMCDLRHRIAVVARAGATVLITGESGVGKEVAARAIHALSRLPGAFVAVNCAAIPESLAESQLFGHAAGSFTGARAAHPGYFRTADGGTLLLDEVGELPLALQPKLLRALEEGAVVPVGGTTPIACRVRLLAATNRDLVRAVAEQRFRGDLLARLDEVRLRPPPLRERREDVLLLLGRALGGDPVKLTPRLVDRLLRHAWPFNVRELIKVASQLALYGAGRETLDADLVAERLPGADKEERAVAAPEAREVAGKSAAAAQERSAPPTAEALRALYRECNGNISELARRTGRSRRQVRRWLEEAGEEVE